MENLIHLFLLLSPLPHDSHQLWCLMEESPVSVVCLRCYVKGTQLIDYLTHNI